jgi:hypothetical protein
MAATRQLKRALVAFLEERAGLETLESDTAWL